MARRVEASFAVLGMILALGAAGLTERAASAEAGGTAEAEGKTLFTARCAACHEPAVGRAPPRARLATLGQTGIFNSLDTGVMKPMAGGLSQAQMHAIAAYLAPPSTTAVAEQAPTDPPPCADRGRMGMTAGDWNGWGHDLRNWRLQPAPGITAAAIPRLKVKWALAHYGGKYGQPTIVGGRVFAASAGGKIYSLDARTGCLRWRLDGMPSRTTISVGRLAGVAPSGFAAFIGGVGGTVYAVDAADGKPLWRAQAQSHPMGILTGAPVLYQDRLYVPLSSFEELTASRGDYSCCTFRGGVVALDARTGKILWTTHTIEQAAAPSHKNSAGTQMFGPAGAAVWSAPTIDAQRHRLYLATGDSYTNVAESGSDSILALDLADGRILWKTQVTRGDNYLSGCAPENHLVNCPDPVGHDYDFGAAPILVGLGGGRDIIMAGQKSGMVYGLDPDHGAILWRTQVGEGGPLGGVEWGMASDGRRLYVAISDPPFSPATKARPGLSAIDPATGKVLWFAPSPKLGCGHATVALCVNGLSAPPSEIPGAVFAGDTDGHLRAYAPGDGHILWDFDVAGRIYDTINGVNAVPGGNLDGPGPTIAGGMLFVYSGYLGSLGGAPTNALLAFSIDGT